MCGIFGYIGPTSPKASRGKSSFNAAQIVFEGLKRLEYRGYDSWGLAVLNGKQEISLTKKVGAIGEVSNLAKIPTASIGIGHTRWATHGAVSEINAHPHFSSDKGFVLAQNGIVENYLEIAKKLISKGYKFKTETDTEAIVYLIEDYLKDTRDLRRAVMSAFLKLEGRNTIILLTRDKRIIACRNGSPLVIGKNGMGEIFFSSDTLSFASKARKMLVVQNGELVDASLDKVELFDIKSGKKLPVNFENIDIETATIDKEGYPHFMLKEINEVPYAVRVLLNQDKESYFELAKVIREARTVYCLGSGTAGIAASQIAYFLRKIAKIRAISLVGADSASYFELFEKGDLIIAPSQSGETADVLEVLEVAKKKGVKIASIVNMPGSMMTKLSDFKFMSQAGPEICVVSTKVFVSQIAWGYLVSQYVVDKGEEAKKILKKVADDILKFLSKDAEVEKIGKLAHKLTSKSDIFILGLGQNMQIAYEGMIKMIECSYKHAHAIASGDLKHWAITLMEKDVPVLVLASNDEVKDDVLNAASQVKARGVNVIGLSPFNHQSFDTWIKTKDLNDASSIFNVVSMQLLGYFMAVKLGNNVDRPRNIAKSVTVK